MKFVSSDPARASAHILAVASQRAGVHVHLANAYTVALADQSAEYRDVLAGSALNFPDGKPIGWVSRLRQHSPLLQQVRGPQLFLDVFDQGRQTGTRHFLLGSTPEVLLQLTTNLERDYPGVDIVGVASPPFRKLTPVELATQDEQIKASGAEIVWIGLGTPKQDIEAQRLAVALPITAIAIGAAFDFAAGTLNQAPVWMRTVGFEWLYRFASEPRRLWRRYLFGNARFLKAALLTPTS
ncbi:WecB/TagA/CpsF family glycosyltransferase [Cryobacterium sp. Y11]|uniref:WecB/TagA/CpsF family glycosyltransferase n=1 Tax=Cryobacterium sp. Y11 TaxID=2045016 RepID=UPI001304DF9E|nr:WecB/TagA/CpsF family glycosyltransferase [Cryobacterium sp. Y11]